MTTMDLAGLKLYNLGINKDKFGKIQTFIDFGNVNYWFERDERDGEGNTLTSEQKLVIDLEKLSDFLRLFSDRTNFYFGLDDKNPKSVGFISKARNLYDAAHSKPIQWIKHHMSESEAKGNTRPVNKDLEGDYIYLPKCNFDVEICVDAIRLAEYYDTVCLLSSDSDFTELLDHLSKRLKKKVILISAGHVASELKNKANLNINGQQIKKDIVKIKTTEKPRLLSGI